MKIWISEIEFQNGQKFTIEPDEIVVFVGPNNSGKSVCLNEIYALLHNPIAYGPVVKSIKLRKTGDLNELIAFAEPYLTGSAGNGTKWYGGYQFRFDEQQLKSTWNFLETRHLNDLTNFLCNKVSTIQRLTATASPQSIDLLRDAPSHPIHFLQKDDQLEAFFNNLFRQAFVQDVIVHRNAGSHVPLYVGNKPEMEPGEDRVSKSYLTKLELLDRLETQGDGIRAFTGVLLTAFIPHYRFLFVDEPEAFLYPAQSRLLGKMIAKDLNGERQIFISTHNEDFLKGILESGAKNLKVVRITRSGKLNTISALHNNDINNLWSDSLLRHSNVLGGLFHSKVLICESDSDAQFYSAMLDAVTEPGKTIPDYLFIPVGGKHRFPMVINALKKLNVEIKVIGDFDVLRDMQLLKQVYENLGGDWKEIETDWKIVKSEIEQKKPQLETKDVKEQISKILSEVNTQYFPEDKNKQIKDILKKTSAWSLAKSNGKSFIPNGNATQAFLRMQEHLKRNGLLIVEIGELENFCKSIGDHGPGWVNEVLEKKDLKKDIELDEARRFVSLL